MVLGIVGLALCWLPFVGWVCALVGIILAVLGMGKAKKLGGKGKGMAIAGLVCGIIGIAIGVLLFALTMMAASAFDSYVKKGKRSEAQLQLRSIEVRAKTFHVEKARLPVSAPEMPTDKGPDCIYRKASQSAWAAHEGWRELGFHVDEDSRCTYEFVAASANEAKAIARCDLDCDGNPSVSTVTLTVANGNVTATYDEPTPD